MKWSRLVAFGTIPAAAIFSGCVNDAAELGVVTDDKSSSALPYEIVLGDALGIGPATPLGVANGGVSNDNSNDNDNGAGNTNDNGGGNDNGGNTNDNGGGNTNDNGAGNTNDNGAGNTNDNGAGNTNDNGAGNTNDNGAGNTNDNGAGNTNDNMNDNGGNTNDNTNDNGSCPGGAHGVQAELSGGGGEGDMKYEELPGGCKEFRARVDEGLSSGVYDVTVNNVVVGQIVVDSRGRGELRYKTEDGNFPAGFPRIESGDVGAIGSLSGSFGNDCPSEISCNGNGNDNGAGNTNDNGAGNTNDNGAGNTNSNAP